MFTAATHSLPNTKCCTRGFFVFLPSCTSAISFIKNVLKIAISIYFRFISEQNTTFQQLFEDENNNIEEDVLYQKGASFSAKLDDTNEHITNHINIINNRDDDEDDDNTSYENDKIPKIKMDDWMLSENNIGDLSVNFLRTGVKSTTPQITTTTITTNQNDEYYSKEDMSVYDDVNNNKLNLKRIYNNIYNGDNSADTTKSYIQIQEYVTSKSLPEISTKLTEATASVVTKDDSITETIISRSR